MSNINKSSPPKLRLSAGDRLFLIALVTVPAAIAALIIMQPQAPNTYRISATFLSPDRRHEFRLLCDSDWSGHANDRHQLEVVDRESRKVLYATEITLHIDVCGDESSEGPFTWANRHAFFDRDELAAIGVE